MAGGWPAPERGHGWRGRCTCDLTVQQIAPDARKRILVVDDEPLVGRAVKRVLTAHADVHCCTNALDALELLRDGQTHFDLVLCDLMMPEMTGPEFRAALLAIRPEMGGRLIFITGGAFTPEMEEFLSQSACPHILKPFDVPVLRSIVADRLAAA